MGEPPLTKPEGQGAQRPIDSRDHLTLGTEEMRSAATTKTLTPKASNSRYISIWIQQRRDIQRHIENSPPAAYLPYSIMGKPPRAGGGERERPTIYSVEPFCSRPPLLYYIKGGPHH